jgi:hypothetical protein
MVFLYSGHNRVKRDRSAWQSFAITCLFCSIWPGCSRDGRQTATAPVARRPTASVTSVDAAPLAAALEARPFSPLLVPAANPDCPAAFPHGYRFVGRTETDARKLFTLIWLDGKSRGDYVVATAADTPAARCFAVGPHRDLNITDWCCR